MLKVISAALTIGLLLGGPAMADQSHKKVMPRRPAPAPKAAAPSSPADLNSPSTDFSGVSPVIEDPAVERNKPHKKRDPNFD